MNLAFLFGTAGWSYKDWTGTVYPRSIPRGFNHLEYLSRDFDFVEVNTTFYHIPSRKLVEGWVRKTRNLSGYSFWIKVNQNFTHKKCLEETEIDAFHEALRPLSESGRLEGCLAQFPYSFHNTDVNVDWLKRVGGAFDRFPLAVEFRHESWNRPEILKLFRKENWVWVNIDQPPVSRSLPLTAYTTSDINVYFRLHGRNSASWFSGEGRDARYDYTYSAAELLNIAEMIRRLKEEAKKIFISGNNHYKGSAVRNLIELKRILIPGNKAEK